MTPQKRETSLALNVMIIVVVVTLRMVIIIIMVRRIVMRVTLINLVLGEWWALGPASGLLTWLASLVLIIVIMMMRISVII